MNAPQQTNTDNHERRPASSVAKHSLTSVLHGMLRKTRAFTREKARQRYGES